MALLLVGLGNPGSEYESTRHNIGFRVLEAFAESQGCDIKKKGFSSFWSKVSVGGKDIFLQLPQTYMNLSGQSVRGLLDYYHLTPEKVMVVHDEMDLPLGKLKKAFGSGSAGHRGVSSVTEHLGTKDFWRIRMGVGRPERKEGVVDFVLQPFTREEESSVQEMVQQCVSLLNEFILEAKQ